MASKSQTELYISISFPDLDFDTKAVLDTQSDVGPRERFRMESKENEVQVTLTADVDITIRRFLYMNHQLTTNQLSE